MRILLLTPGTGHFYCGSCLRDNGLATALEAEGHDVSIAPLYLPFHLEEESADRSAAAVRMGGINVYLAEKLPTVARMLPGPLADWLDSPALLRWASRRGDMTDVSALGAMTVSMLRGEEGRQSGELTKLIDWVRAQGTPDIIVLSNALLLGLARRLRAELGCPVICTLQGEPPFLDSLPEPHRSEAWSTMAGRAREIEGFVAVSEYTRDLMVERLGLAAERVHVAPNGIDPSDFAGLAVPEGGPPTLGFLARMCADKGLDTLVDAFLILARRPGLEDLRLRAAGVELEGDREYVAVQREKLAAAGLGERAEFLPNISRREKLELLGSLTAFSVPATYGESFGLYLLEALASGVPIVQPRHGAFAEIVEATKGGRLCDPNNAESLATALEPLLLDRALARRLGEQGRTAVGRHYTATHMARRVAEICRMSTTVAPR